MKNPIRVRIIDWMDMSRFSKPNFVKVIKEIQDMEKDNQNIWVPIGILEWMYSDDCGYIDYYFHHPRERNIDVLWEQLCDHINRNRL